MRDERRSGGGKQQLRAAAKPINDETQAHVHRDSGVALVAKRLLRTAKSIVCIALPQIHQTRLLCFTAFVLLSVALRKSCANRSFSSRTVSNCRCR